MDEKRVANMFEVFGELSQTQSLKLVKHNSIGIGLNCSKVLANFLEGDVKLISWKPGAFSIQVILPVRRVSSSLKKHMSSENMLQNFEQYDLMDESQEGA